MFLCPSMPAYVEETRRLADEMAPMWVEASRRVMGRAMGYVAFFWLGIGDRKRAEEMVREYAKLIHPANEPRIAASLLMSDACFNIIDGRLGEAAEAARGIARISQEAHWPGAAVLRGFPGTRLVAYLGQAAGALEETEQWEKTTGVSAGQPYKAYLQAHAGRQAEARAILDNVVGSYIASSDEIKDLFSTEFLYMEAAVQVRNTRAAELLLNHLADTPFKTTGFWYPTCIVRHLGAAAALLGRHDEARKYYDEAIKVCTEMRFRPELALSRLQLAELLLEHYPQEKSEAVAHLDSAIKEFRDMKMQPSLERALRHKEILKV